MIQMAHVVGVPKREPCQKCSMPVFLAERLTVGKHVYHRTCLKCARCNSQLTPGSFYETETDGEFCCETCPDEEKSLDNAGPSSDVKITIGSAESNRTSIADRLAFFENDGKKLLQKSLSDEEKSKSLKKITEAQKFAYKQNPALSSFMTSHLRDETDSGGEGHSDSRRNSKTDDLISSSSVASSDSETEDLSMDPPELPKSLPPASHSGNDASTSPQPPRSPLKSMENTSQSSKPSVLPKPQLSPLPTPKRQKQLSNTESENHPTTITEDSGVNIASISSSTSRDIDKNKSISSSREKLLTTDTHDENLDLMKTISDSVKKQEIEEIETESKMEIVRIEPQSVNGNGYDERKISLNVTKDNPDVSNEQMRPNDVAATISISDEQREVDEPSSLTTAATSANRSSMVRARLHQFETIANSSSPSSINSISDIGSNSISGNQTLEEDESIKKSISDEISLSMESKVPKNISNSNEDINNYDEEKDSSDKSTKDKDFNNKEDQQLVENDVQQDQDIESKLNNASYPPDQVDYPRVDANQQSSVDIEMKLEENLKEEKEIIESSEIPSKVVTNSERVTETLEKSKPSQGDQEYPEDLNPFNSDDDDVQEADVNESLLKKEKRKSLNPFDSSDDENTGGDQPVKKVKPPRPPPPKKISTNPFGSESEDENSMTTDLSHSTSTPKRTPIPTPRNHLSGSQQSTPEPTPRLTRPAHAGTPLKNTSDYYGSNASLASSTNIGGFKSSTDHLARDDTRGSSRSVASSSAGTKIRKMKKAPAPPPPPTTKSGKDLFPKTIEDDSLRSSPSSSNSATPQQPRKKRPAPAPPSLTASDAKDDPNTSLDAVSSLATDTSSIIADVTNTDEVNISHESPPHCPQTEEETEVIAKSSADECQQTTMPAPTELGNPDSNVHDDDKTSINTITTIPTPTPKRRLISIDESLQNDRDDFAENNKQIYKEEENVVYRRTIPLKLDLNADTEDYIEAESHDRQLEKLKDNKEAQNRNRQSQISPSSSPHEDNDPVFNKSIHGKWKRRKGPAPALPVPPKKVLQMLPLQEIRHELEIIEVQQQGLEKQGVVLEKMIRERCEGQDGTDPTIDCSSVVNSKEVEDLIMQLFELVNEKNELFRRQAELMYLRRQHRLEQEQADLEYEIRVLMAQPERNKTDSDKAREEVLIARLVEVVQLRNEVVDCLEMDRLREAEEDLSIKQRLEMHTAKRDEELCHQTPTKLSKKEKKKQKEQKKLGKSKKIDADKDADESELNAEKQKTKKKKKKFLF